MTKPKPIGEIHLYITYEYDTKRHHALSLFIDDFEDTSQLVDALSENVTDILNLSGKTEE
jgi:hypothetical protein